MRVRNKPWAPKLIAEHPEMVVENGQAYKGKWHERFAKQQPLWIEVGTGKGQFIINMAKKYPQYNFIGIEIQKTVVAMALKNALAEELPNLQFLHADGAELTDYFADGEVDQLFLNFSDPWPKTRHEKRRLDLHNSPENEDNVETEYEHKFSEKGQPIYKLVAHF
ncbi:tRNA (guanosine(46)-N7)-methyltransferase TrmB [Pediococcus acidilactici]|uniref:tRNA (guanosine(46)-N7)-methyltransferase TrmB n=1 Tax=Pediococcus acidilactici TaxID=1254 RepID=UPI000FFCB42E|nr:tRNA (guanosine(46)-N7)-methyltransferase TrmB [Pediococcus acidilactici]RXA50976.1 tRNA (guanosine(46)-N7)-methyltransferase TrmB [Pediococcus acidilactici]